MDREFEVGMEVVLYGGFYNRPIQLATIVNISPKYGHITIQHRDGEKERLNKHGFQFGDGWHSAYIKPATDERKKAFYDATAISKCRLCVDDIQTLIQKKLLTADTARQIVKALGQIDIPSLQKYAKEVE